MSWFFSAIPYILAAGTIFLSGFQLVKEWDEYETKRWLRISVFVMLIVVGCLTFVSLHLDNKAKAEEKSKAEGDIRDLNGKVQAANDAQRENTKLFVDSFGAMSKEVSNLKAEVKTEALQRKLSTVEAELQKTQRAMAPGPKAELTFTFTPFVNPPLGSNAATNPVTETTLPIGSDASVHVEFAVLNMTDVGASDVDLDVVICDGCKYAKEPEGMQKNAAMPPNIRVTNIPHLQPLSVSVRYSVDVIPPPLARVFPIGITYRCTNCIVPKGAPVGVVHVKY